MEKNTCSCLLALVLSVAYDGEISEGQLQGKKPSGFTLPRFYPKINLEMSLARKINQVFMKHLIFPI